MFWSLVLEPSKRYSSTVKDTFHLSMAALDIKTTKHDNDIYPVLIEVDGQELVLCNLNRLRSPHANLDLMFNYGTEITFSTSGKATIHLTGYLTEDDNLDDQDSDVDDQSDSSEDREFLNTISDIKASKNAKENKKNIQQSPIKRKMEQAETGSKKKPKKQIDDGDDSSTDLDENALGELVDSLNKSGSDSELEDESDDDNLDSMNTDSSLDDEEDDDESVEDSEDEKPKFLNTPKNKKGKDALPQKTPPNKTPVSTKKDKNEPSNGIPHSTGKKDKNQTPKPEQKTPKNKDQKANQTPQSKKNTNATPQSQKKQTLPGGVTIEELKPGNGPVAKSGKMVAVYYTGRLKNNNRVFDQSNQGAGFKFRLGNNEVIKGWDIGLNGMKVGSKRRITCPPAMAYGNKGSPPQIPPNSWLVFDVELKSIN